MNSALGFFAREFDMRGGEMEPELATITLFAVVRDPETEAAVDSASSTGMVNGNTVFCPVDETGVITD